MQNRWHGNDESRRNARGGKIKKYVRKELKERMRCTQLLMAYLCSWNVRFFCAGLLNTRRTEANNPPLTKHAVSVPHSEGAVHFTSSRRTAEETRIKTPPLRSTFPKVVSSRFSTTTFYAHVCTSRPATCCIHHILILISGTVHVYEATHYVVFSSLQLIQLNKNEHCVL